MKFKNLLRFTAILVLMLYCITYVQSRDYYCSDGDPLELLHKTSELDFAPLEITCPDSIVVNNDLGACGAVVSYTVIASGGTGLVTIDQIGGVPSGEEFPIGTVENTYIATDESGDTVECSFVVIVNDIEIPTVVCPGDVTVSHDAGSCGTMYTISPPDVTENCGLDTFRMEISGFQSINYVFAPQSGELNQPRRLMIDDFGNLYVGDLDSTGVTGGTIKKYDQNGNLLLEIGSPSGSTSLAFPRAMVIGTDGNLYVASERSHEILRFNPISGVFIDAFVPAGSGGLDRPHGLEFRPDGNLYVSSATTASVKRYDATTGVYIDDFVASGDGGLAAAWGLTFGPDGNLYVTDLDPGSVLRYDGTSGAFMDVFVSPGSGGLSFAETCRFGPDGDLYVTSFGSGEVLRYNGSTGAFIESVVPSAFGMGVATGLVFNDDGNLFVSNTSRGQVIRVPSDEELELPVGTTTVTVTVSDASGIPVECSYSITIEDTQGPTLSCPGDVTVEADPGSCGSIYTISPGDVIENCGLDTFRMEISGFQPINYVFAPQSGELNQPRRLMIDDFGNLYVGNLDSTGVTGGTIKKYDQNGNLLLEIGSPSGSTSLAFPRAMVIGTDGNLLVASERSHQVLRFDPNSGAIIDTFITAGSGGLDRPHGLEFGPDGQLYVSSATTASVKRYDATTGAYIDDFVVSGSGGLAAAWGHTFGPDGNLYVTDLQPGSVFRYDGLTGSFIDVFVAPGSGGLDVAEECRFGPDGDLYVSSFNSGEVLRYDGVTGAFIESVVPDAFGFGVATGLVFDADGNLFVSNTSKGQIIRVPSDEEVELPIGTTTVTITISDESGNLVECSYSITVEDTQGPSVTCPGDVTVEADPGLCSASVVIPPIIATDQCGVISANLSVGGSEIFDYVFVDPGSGGLDGPRPLIFGPDGNLYVSNFGPSINEGSILRFNGMTGAFIDEFVSVTTGLLEFPRGLRFGPDGNLYVASRETDEILKFNGVTGALISVFVAPGTGGLDRPTGIIFGPGNDLYVSNVGTNQILKFDGTTGAFVGVFVDFIPGTGSEFPVGLDFGPDGNLYVAALADAKITRYNGTTGAYIDDFVPTGAGGLVFPEALEFGPDGNLYVTSFNPGKVLRYDGTTGAFIDEVSAQGIEIGFADGLTFGPDGHLYASSIDDDQIVRYPLGALNFDVGDNVVTYTGNDAGGLSATCDFIVTVQDVEPPVVVASLTKLPGGGGNCKRADFEVGCEATDNCGSDGLITSSVIELASYNPNGIKFKTKNFYKVVIKSNGKVTVNAPDPQAFWTTLLADGGIAVTDGQVLDLTSTSSGKSTYNFDSNGEMTAAISSNIVLTCTVEDLLGNQASDSVSPVFPCGNAVASIEEMNIFEKTESGPDPDGPEIHVFPNPTFSLINLEMDGIQLEGAKVVLNDHLGRTVWFRNLDSRSNRVAIDIDKNQIESGIYVVLVITDDEIYSERVIVVK